eukprot:COSAG02_NODE_3999_length_5933_cov_3.627871_7_plen_97_part_00
MSVTSGPQLAAAYTQLAAAYTRRLACHNATAAGTHRTSATSAQGCRWGPCAEPKLLASAACGSLSSERGFFVVVPTFFWTPRVRHSSVPSHSNLGT